MDLITAAREDLTTRTTTELAEIDRRGNDARRAWTR